MNDDSKLAKNAAISYLSAVDFLQNIKELELAAFSFNTVKTCHVATPLPDWFEQSSSSSSSGSCF